MKAKTLHEDFIGTVSADTSDAVGAKSHLNDMEAIGKYLKLDKSRFKSVGLRIFGTGPFFVSLLCVDLKASKDEEIIIEMELNHIENQDILKLLFKDFDIVLYDKFDQKYSEMNRSRRQVNFSDLHTIKGSEEENKDENF